MGTSKIFNVILSCLYFIIALKTVINPMMWNKWCLAGLFAAWGMECATKALKKESENEATDN